MTSIFVFAAGDFSSPWSFWGILGLIVAFVAPRIVWEWWERRSKRRLLKHIWLIECFGTVRKLKPVLNDIEDSAKKDRGPDRLSFLVRFPATITVAGVSPELQELLSLLPRKEGTSLVRFLDRWSRFQLLVAKYEAAYNAAIQASAKAEVTSDLQLRLADEYIQQTVTNLNQSFWMGHRLCDIACATIRTHGPHQDCDLHEVCEGLWNNWKEHAEEHKRYRKEDNVCTLIEPYLPPCRPPTPQASDNLHIVAE